MVLCMFDIIFDTVHVSGGYIFQYPGVGKVELSDIFYGNVRDQIYMRTISKK